VNPSELLSGPHLSVIARYADYELSRIFDIIQHKAVVGGRGELEELFGALLRRQEGREPTPKTLDLIGHSMPGRSLLMLGDWVIDTASPTVTAFFRELAEQEVLNRLGVEAVRLLGCQTADTGRGRSTVRTLSDILGIDVYGTRHLIYSAHYDANGFRADSEHVLVGSSEIRRGENGLASDPAGDPYPRTLDIDTLPAVPLIVREHAWPRRIATPEIARQILRLVRRREGAQMPGLLAAPNCEVALPSGKPSWFYLAQILLDGEFIRVYPEGDRKPGVLYPVDDPHALRMLVETLPAI